MSSVSTKRKKDPTQPSPIGIVPDLSGKALILEMYKNIVTCLEGSKTSLENGKRNESSVNLLKARRILVLLMENLDPESGVVAGRLFALYCRLYSNLAKEKWNGSEQLFHISSSIAILNNLIDELEEADKKVQA